jgi:hypothetical protein
MRLMVHIEDGDLGMRAGVAYTTIMRPNEVNILFDPSRIPPAQVDGVRDLIIRELDLALFCLTYGGQPETVRLLRPFDNATGKGN